MLHASLTISYLLLHTFVSNENVQIYKLSKIEQKCSEKRN